MSYPTHDTEWALSAKGNYWRRLGGKPLIVGKGRDGEWWARSGDDFIKGTFPTQHDAMTLAEASVAVEACQEGNHDWSTR